MASVYQDGDLEACVGINGRGLMVNKEETDWRSWGRRALCGRFVGKYTHTNAFKALKYRQTGRNTPPTYTHTHTSPTHTGAVNYRTTMAGLI